MPCGKESYVEVSNPRIIKDLCDKVMPGELFGFLQVDIHIPDGLLEKFSEFSPLFIVDEVPDNKIPQHMKDYQKRTDRKTISGTKKLLGVTRATGISLYMPMLKWYLSHGTEVTAIHKYLKYESGKPFSWFPGEVSCARREGDSSPALKQLRDTHKLKGNSFYRKMIEDLMKHIRMTFTTNENLVDQSFRSPYLVDLEEINGAFEVKNIRKE